MTVTEKIIIKDSMAGDSVYGSGGMTVTQQQDMKKKLAIPIR